MSNRKSASGLGNKKKDRSFANDDDSNSKSRDERQEQVGSEEKQGSMI
jgi:hypothetical protein